MARIKKSIHGQTPFQNLLGHHLKVMEAWSNLGEELEKGGHLSVELKEQVRRTLAQENGCEYCKAKGKPDPNKIDEKTSIAIGFADLFTKQKSTISNSTFNILKQFFSDEEISELCAFICFMTAQQYFGAMLNLNADADTR